MTEDPSHSGSSRRSIRADTGENRIARLRFWGRSSSEVVGKRSLGARNRVEASGEDAHSSFDRHSDSAQLVESADVTGPEVVRIEDVGEEEPRHGFSALKMLRLRRPPLENRVKVDLLESDESRGIDEDLLDKSLPRKATPAPSSGVSDGDEDSRPAPRSRSGRGSSRSDERVGMRARRRQIERERRRRAGVMGVGILAVTAGVTALVIAILIGTVVIPDGSGGGGAVATRTLLLIGIDSAALDNGAKSLTLFGVDDDGTASIVFLPTGTSSEIPARGPDRLGDALSLGSPHLMRLSVENLLGIRVDSVLVLDLEGMRHFFDPLAPIPIVIPERLSILEDNVLVPKFTPGTYDFDSSRLVEYMNFAASGESEVQRLSRHQRAWEAIMEKANQIDGGMSMASSLAAASLVSSTEVQALGKFLDRVSDADRGYALLPVDPKQSLEGEERYEPRTEEIQAMVNQRFAGARSSIGDVERVRLGILNGNGGVGVTEEVANILIPEGYRVVFTENADHFNYMETQIVFGRTPFEDVARDIQRKLGTGKLVFNRSPQDVADIIVVVGKDFPPSR